MGGLSGYIRRGAVSGEYPAGMEHLEEFTDLEWLLREVYSSLNGGWRSRILRPWSLAASIAGIKSRHPLFLQVKNSLPQESDILQELRANSTIAYQRILVPQLPIENRGRVLASLSFISSLADLWESFPICHKPSRRHRLHLLVVPFWLKICNALMNPKAMELDRIKMFRLGIYKELGEMRSRDNLLTSVEDLSGSQATLVPRSRGSPEGRRERSSSDNSSSSEASTEVWQPRESESGEEGGGDTGSPDQRQLRNRWSPETTV